MSSNNFLFAQCNAMCDAVIDPVSDEFLAARPFLKRNQAVMADSDEQVHTLIKDAAAALPAGKSVRITPGGSGLATSRVVSWIFRENKEYLRDGADKKVSVLSVINDDEHGKIMKDALESEGVDSDFLMSFKPESQQQTRGTGVCVVLVGHSDNSRTMFVLTGAWKNLSCFDDAAVAKVEQQEQEQEQKKQKEHIDTLFEQNANLKKSLAARQNSDVQYLTGFSLVASPAFVSASVPLGGDCRCAAPSLLCCNLSAQFVIESLTKELITLAAECDIVFCNAEEGAAAVEAFGIVRGDDGKKESATATTAKLLAGFLLEKKRAGAAASCKRCGGENTSLTVIVTDGPDPVAICMAAALPAASSEEPQFFASGGRARATFALTTFPVPPVPASAVVDTCGCGDAFVGGFLAGLRLFRDQQQDQDEPLSIFWRRLCVSEIRQNNNNKQNDFVRRAVALGHSAAGFVITQTGTTLPAGSAPKLNSGIFA